MRAVQAEHAPWLCWKQITGLAMLGLLAVSAAWAGGPRFVTNSTFAGATPGTPMGFFTHAPLYYTDPGNLSATVTHAQADAMVAAAANVWNVPTADLTLAQGGTLSEHVSGANTYFNGAQMVFPADVQASNYLSKPIAIVYDTDGSVIDLLLGAGASAPSGCRQNAVIESVDSFGQTGTIQHALIVLNGRCTGTTSDGLTQMQYQLARIFGRVLGLSWSQCNDNVFTGTPAPNAAQLLYWPLMHPIDVICGTYSYKCMPNPFTLRADDLSALTLLYPVTSANMTPGKTPSLDATTASADVMYMFQGYEGMEQVNVVASLWPYPFAEDPWQVASGVVGARYLQDHGNPVTNRAGTSPTDWGSTSDDLQRHAVISRFPFGTSIAALALRPENINPLYHDDYAVGPYRGTPITMSGTAWTDTLYWGYAHGEYQNGFFVPGAATNCNPGNDGVEGSPVAADPSGWWTGLLCGVGHTSWGSATVKAGRTWTLEVTALDESGIATVSKLRPLIGVWGAGDPTGTLPTMGATPAPMNSLAGGTTQLHMGTAASDTGVRFTVADQFGEGRPDFAYQARLLYADSVAPVSVGVGGGQITISGQGFRQGNRVLVNGVTAMVTSWSATQIVAIAPSMSAAGATGSTPVSVGVLDSSTGGTATISSALTYVPGAVDTLQVMSAPAALETGVQAPVPFAVRMLASDGTPRVGAPVQFTSSGGNVTFGACGAASCTVLTNGSGTAQTLVTGTAAGAVTLVATDGSGNASIQVTVQDADPVRVVALAESARYLAAGAAASWPLSLTVTQDGVAAGGVAVSWSGSIGVMASGAAATVASGGSPAGPAGSAAGSASTGGLAAGQVGVATACVWTSVCASESVYGVGAPDWRIAVLSGAGQSVGSGAHLASVTLLVTDVGGHPLQGATVQVYQTVSAWEGVCPAQGRCAAAPVLASAQSTAVSDANGWVVVTPLEVAGVPEVVNVALVTGTQGFVSLALIKTP